MSEDPDKHAWVVPLAVEDFHDACGSDGYYFTHGDCWCTLPPRHDGECRCQPCAERYGARDWPHFEGCCQ